MTKALEHRTALVTGGATGIGAAIARRLGRSGARVAFTCNASGDAALALAEEVRSDGGTVFAIQADFRSPAEIQGAVVTTVEALGRIDLLVNNAALSLPNRVEQIELDMFDEVVAVNLKGAFLAVQATLPHMPRGGRVINIGSISSNYMPIAGNSLYSMTKADLQGLTKGLVRELREREITINTVEPGRIETAMLRTALKDRYDAARRHGPLGRFGTVDEVAAMVEYLCSDAAGYVTGASLRVDGGTSIG